MLISGLIPGADNVSPAQIVIKKPMQDCFNVAADLDGYLPWCGKGGMKDIQVNLSSRRRALQGYLDHKTPPPP